MERRRRAAKRAVLSAFKTVRRDDYVCVQRRFGYFVLAPHGEKRVMRKIKIYTENSAFIAFDAKKRVFASQYDISCFERVGKNMRSLPLQ